MKSGGYKISALDIEREILALPYIQEVSIVGIEDEEFGQRVAAAVVLRDGGSLSIDELRQALRERLAGYKMPTLMRIVGGELPKSATGKVSKKILGPELFPPNYREHKEVQVWTPSDKASVASKAKL